MGWLIQMLLEAVSEQCSQFIIDMMEIVNQVFTELLSYNLDLFEEKHADFQCGWKEDIG